VTSQEKQQVLDTVEKRPLSSKKFVAWLLQQVIMATMAIVALVTQPVLGWPLSIFMTGIVFMQGASTMYFIGRQAALDSAIRGFAMIGKPAPQIPVAKKED